VLYGFLDFELDEQGFELTRAGAPVAVQPKAFDVLVYLVQRRERVVTKKELLDHVWGGVKIQENTLAQTVASLRRSLHEEVADRVLETVRTRGYRFIAEVRAVERNAAPRSPSQAFVGREPLMQALRTKFEEVLDGTSAVALISGGPGLGKTRLLAEVAKLAPGRGARQVALRCHRAEGVPELWPFQQILRQLGAEPALLDEVGAASSDPERRFLLFDHFTGALKHAARREPLVVLLDDLQWADVPSLLLFGYVARELADARVFLVAAYSDASMQNTLARTIGGLLREDPSRRFALTPLGKESVAELAEQLLGHRASPELLARLFLKTGGNPALLLQMLALSAAGCERPSLVEDTSALLSDDTTRAAIALQLGALSEACQNFLGMAAVFGSEFDACELSPLTQIEPVRALELLNEATRGHVLSKTGKPQAYRFRHGLVQDVLLRGLPAARRVELETAIREARSTRSP